MKMEKGFKKPLARQIREGVEIEMSRDTLMNGKSEWNSSRIPRIVIEEGERQVEDLESALGKKGEQEKRERRREYGEVLKNGKRKGEELSKIVTEGKNRGELIKRRRVEMIVPQKRHSKESVRHKQK